MANTFELIASSTVGSGGVSSIIFSSIPQTYTDLLLKVSIRDGDDNQAFLKFNSSTTGYSALRLQGTGAVAQSTTDSSTSQGVFGYSVNQNASRTANTFGNAEIYIPNYTGSTAKSFSSDGVEENNATTAYSKLFAGLLTATAAITSITLSSNTTSAIFYQYSTAYLYGVKSS